MITTSMFSMIIANRIDAYSIKHDRLSYTGIRRDFVHPKRGIKYSKNTYPEILNFGLIIAGILEFLGFLRIEFLLIRIVGIIFSFILIIIGAIDVSTHYDLHNRSVFASQPMFLILTILILIKSFNLFTLSVLIIILILAVVNVYQQQIQNRNPGLKINVIPQKLFIYIEIIYLIAMSYIID